MSTRYILTFESYLRHELRRSPHTITAYIKDVEQFASWITNDNVDRFNPVSVAVNDVRTWVATLMRQGCEARSVRRKVQSLRAFFRFLLKQKRISVNPASSIPLPKIPKRLPEVIKAEEIEDLLRAEESLINESIPEYSAEDGEENPDSCGNERIRESVLRNNLIIEMFYTLGIRRAELVAISDSDISQSAGEIKIHGKRDKDRVIPVPKQLMTKITTWQSMRDFLWPDLPSPKPLFVVKGKRISAAQVYTSVKRQLEGVSSAKKSPHALRHSFATAMLNEGAEINSVKEFLGHASLATTQIYTHVSFAEMKNAYNAAHPRAKGKDS